MTTGDQFYVTHCATADSVLNHPGYAVRAASTTDPSLLDAAFHFPPYELPIDLWKDLPDPKDAPRRLARINHPAGGVWAAHSSYMEKDATGRDRSYFSHLMLLASATPIDVLRSWGASGWVKGYPPGAAKSLEGVEKLPVGKFVNDAALTAFLGESPAGPTDLCVAVCPTRLRGSLEGRRELFARFLHAVLLGAEAGDSRRRLYVHAEPGLVALLLYGAVRLLPRKATEGLTFSTFEPHHRNIRDVKFADVVGTYLGSPDKGLGPDLGTRGVVLDTFVGACSSPELRGGVGESLPPGVGGLVELAAAGEWAHLPAVKREVGADASGLHNVGDALAHARRREEEASRPVQPPPLPPLQGQPKPPPPTPAPTQSIATAADEAGPPPPRPSPPPLPPAPPVADDRAGAPSPPPIPTPAAPEPRNASEAPPPRPTTPTPRSDSRGPKARRGVLVKLSALALLALATVGVIAAGVKFWPRPEPAPPEVVDADSSHTPAADPPVLRPSSTPAPPRPGQRFDWEIAPGVKMAFCWIPPGEAQLGSPKSEQDYLSRTLLNGTRPPWLAEETESRRGKFATPGFWLGKYEVTQAEWVAVMGSNPSKFNGTNANKARGLNTARFPVESVSWHDCQRFLQVVNGRHDTSTAFGSPGVFVLPDEDEWEYACRGGLGNARAYYWGNELNGSKANCDGTHPYGTRVKGPSLGRTAAVGSYASGLPHPWGLCDMHGNVAEWCGSTDKSRGDWRPLRGGGWHGYALDSRSAHLGGRPPDNAEAGFGFQVCFRPGVGPAPKPPVQITSPGPNTPGGATAVAPMPREAPQTTPIPPEIAVQLSAVLEIIGLAEAARREAAVAELERHVEGARHADAGLRRKAAEGLAKLLADPDVQIRRKASRALAEMGEGAEPAAGALQTASKDPDPVVRAAARQALVKLLVPGLRAKEPEDRVKALIKIAEFGPDGNVAGEMVIEAMRDQVGAVQTAAASALERINPGVHPHVVAILRGPNKRDAILALGELGGEAAIAVPLLLRCNGDVFFWGGGNPKAGKFYEDLFPVIAKIAPKDRRFATAVLGYISAPNAKQSGTLRERRLAGIGQLPVIDAPSGEKVAALIAALADGEAVVPVIKALEGFGADAKPALPALKSLKASPVAATRDAAITAIARIEADAPP